MNKITNTYTFGSDFINTCNQMIDELANKIDKGSICINLMDFGAKCDGTTDDTKAIQKAIDYIESIGGGKILFPYGKTVIVTMQGTRAIQTWHSDSYNRRYALLVGNNVEMDFNYCTISCQLDTSTGYPAPVNIIGNKNASNTDTGNTNIIIRNGIFNQNVPYLNFDITHIGTFDSIAMEFNNTENLWLDNITCQNVVGFGIYVCNSRKFKLTGKTLIQNVMGCCLRIGWGDNTHGGYIENVEIHNCSNIYESFTPGNTIYCNASDIQFDNIYQTLDASLIPTNFDINNLLDYKLGSTNFSNGCNNINVSNAYCNYLGFKIQDYSGNATNSPDNVHIGKIYISNTLFNQQAQKCYIDELIMENGLLTIMNGVYTYINRFVMTKGGLASIKGDYVNQLYINELISINSPGILSTSNNVSIQIRLMNITRSDSTMQSDNNTKYLLNLANANYVKIDKIMYTITSTASVRSNFINLPVGGVIRSITGTITDSNNVTSKYVDSFSITLAVGTQTTINLANNSLGNSDSNIYRNGNYMHKTFELIPMNPTSRAITINSIQEMQYGDKLVINHSTAVGTEPFYVNVLSYQQLPSTVAW